MRKEKGLLVIISFVMFLFFPLCVRAYGIKNFYINATINSDGSITVQEYIDMNGKYNGINREVLFMNNNTSIFDDSLDYLPGTNINNGTDIRLEEIRSVDKNNNFNFRNVKGNLFSIKKGLSFRKNNVYEIKDLGNGYNYKIYQKSYKNKAFYIKYNIDNIIVLHNDVAELGWNLLSDNQHEDIERLIVTINNLGNKDISSWVHGNVNVLSNNVNEDKVQYVFSEVDKYTPISIRVIFDNSIIDQNYHKRTYINAKDKIKTYEKAPTHYDRIQKNGKIVENAKKYTDILEEDATISNYNNALNEIERIYEYNEETRLIKKELLARIDAYKDLPNELYINKIRENIKSLNKSPGFNIYMETINLINENQNGALDDKLKESLMNETLEYSSKVQEDLIESVKKNTCYNMRCYPFNDIEKYIFETDNISERKSFNKTFKSMKKILSKNEAKIHFYCTLIDIGILFMIFVLQFLHKKIKEAKANRKFDQKYLRELPKDYSLEKLSYLLDKDVESRYISSVLLKLINEGVVICKKNSKNDICLEKVVSSKYEFNWLDSLVLDLYFNGRHKITTKEIKKLQKKYKKDFALRYENIIWVIKHNMKSSGLYASDESNIHKEKISARKAILIAFLAILSAFLLPFIWFIEIPMLIIYIIIKNEENFKYIILILIIGFMFFNFFAMLVLLFEFYFVRLPCLIYLIFFLSSFALMGKIIPLLNKNARFSNQGYIDYGMWLAFKRYLCDFSSFKDKDILETHIWEEYMAYANLLGCSKKLLKEIKVSNEVSNFDYDNYASTISSISEINSICRTSSYSSSSSGSSSSWSSSSSGGSSSSSSSSGASSSFGGGGSVGRF